MWLRRYGRSSEVTARGVGGWYAGSLLPSLYVYGNCSQTSPHSIKLLRYRQRLLHIDIEVYRGHSVEESDSATDDVMTVSFDMYSESGIAPVRASCTGW